jgi:chromosome partitioning protein
MGELATETDHVAAMAPVPTAGVALLADRVAPDTDVGPEGPSIGAEGHGNPPDGSDAPSGLDDAPVSGTTGSFSDDAGSRGEPGAGDAAGSKTAEQPAVDQALVEATETAAPELLAVDSVAGPVTGAAAANDVGGGEASQPGEPSTTELAESLAPLDPLELPDSLDQVDVVGQPDRAGEADRAGDPVDAPALEVSEAVRTASHPGTISADSAVGPEAESESAEVLSSEDMALPQPEILDDVLRDQVWGQDRPGHEGKSVAALSDLIEAVTMPAGAEDQEAGMTAATDLNDPTEVREPALRPSAPEPGTGTTAAYDDPDLMEELPSDRPVPADAIKRASEALDAAVNAAPAVLGPVSPVEDDESVALVDAGFTHFDRESGVESEPDGVASDYSGRVTDPIPVQSLSAPGVSRETSGSVQMPQGTQQPTGGPHGGDDERRSALIATVPAVDDTTPVAAELALDARRRIELQGRRFPRPPKTRIITVANQKGGVGKTTTTVNVAAGLAQSGLNVLVIDNDPQGNASTALGIEHRAGTPSVYEILVEGESLASTVQQCPDIPNLWGVPATIDLSGSEIELVSLVSRETRLRKAIDKYLTDRIAAGEERIDYVLIDCPPSLGLLTVNAFVAGREVFIPIQCEYYALEGLSQLLKTIDLIRSHLNPELRVSSILLTMYDGRTNLAQQVAGEVRSHFPAETFKTTIPRSVRISEAPSYGQTVMTYDATSTGALAYLQASRELAERGQGGSSPRRAMQAEPVGAQD